MMPHVVVSQVTSFMIPPDPSHTVSTSRENQGLHAWVSQSQPPLVNSCTPLPFERRGSGEPSGQQDLLFAAFPVSVPHHHPAGSSCRPHGLVFAPICNGAASP